MEDLDELPFFVNQEIESKAGYSSDGAPRDRTQHSCTQMMSLTHSLGEFPNILINKIFCYLKKVKAKTGGNSNHSAKALLFGTMKFS